MGSRFDAVQRLTAPIFWALILCTFSAAAHAACRADQVLVRGEWGQARFSVEIADEPQERAIGLMNRESLPQSAGMLFIYEKPQALSFWMRNTLIELDMLFIDPRGVVQYIHNRAQPLDETPIFGGDGLIAVLEINGGLAARMGIGPGSEIKHPAFGAEAAWACAAE